MIPSFHKFRKKMAKDNLSADKAGRPLKYLRYAIGEIILVMVGILLALQVNSWNQNRLDRIEEEHLISNLHDEFIENKRMIDSNLRKLHNARKANMEILALMGCSKDSLGLYNLDSIFFESLPAVQFSSSNQSIDNITQSGRMNIIKNRNLINLIYQWEAQQSVVRMREDATDSWTYDQILPFLSKYISLKEMDSYGHFEWSGPSKLKKEYHHLFQSLEFENILDNYLFLHYKQYEETEKAGEIVDRILELTAAADS